MNKDELKTENKLRRKTTKKIHPPFGYFGSKNKIAFKLCESLPPHNCWVEVFCGSAALTLAKPPAQIEIINDINDEIVNVFKQLRESKEELCEMIALTPYASKELEDARNGDKGINDLEKARRFLVKSMMAINGVFGKERGGFSSSNSYARNEKEARVNRWYNLPERLSEVSERLRKVRVENKEGLELLKKYKNRPATLAYLDPPYLGKRTNGYDRDANDVKYHTKLLKLSNKAKCMIFISGYENELYDSILTTEAGWVKKTFETSTRGVNGTDNSRTEIIWMNRHFVNALETNEVPVILSEKEILNKKVNPERE